MSETEKTISEQFVQQVSESIKMIFDLTSRIDERVKNLVGKQNELDIRLERVAEVYNTLMSRVSVLESKDISSIKNELNNVTNRISAIELSGSPVIRNEINSLETEIEHIKNKIQSVEIEIKSLSYKTQNSENKWDKIIDFTGKLLWAIVTGFILWKMGFPEPL